MTSAPLASSSRDETGLVQDEFRDHIAGFFGALRLAGRDQFGGGAVHRLQPVLGGLNASRPASKSALNASSLSCRGMGHLRCGEFDANNLAHLPERRYMAVADNIYSIYK
jgi:hypothetical protein